MEFHSSQAIRHLSLRTLQILRHRFRLVPPGGKISKRHLASRVRNFLIKIGKILDSLHLADFDLCCSSQNLLK